MLVLFSPAKINLFFRVLSKRKDGLHEIASLFQAIDLGDILSFKRAEKDALSCSNPKLSTLEDNLVSKAVNLFRKKTGLTSFHVECHIEKQIPIESGVGGGSSNAATTLYACNELAGRPCSVEDLRSWSEDLGSDVPFFFSSGSAYISGRGEKIEEVCLPLDQIFKDPCFLAKPSWGLSTAQVYGACNLKELKERDPKISCQGFMEGNPHWYNDLEQATYAISQRFKAHMNLLRGSGFTEVVLTGSGSGAFCFGRKTPPVLEGVDFYRIRPLLKTANSWYLPEI